MNREVTQGFAACRIADILAGGPNEWIAGFTHFRRSAGGTPAVRCSAAVPQPR